MVAVDLRSMTVRQGDRQWSFDLDDEARTMLMEGLDTIQLTLKRQAEIENFRERDAGSRPWVYLKK